MTEAKRNKDYNEVWKSRPEVKQTGKSKFYIAGYDLINDFIPEVDGKKTFLSLVYIIKMKLKDFDYEDILNLQIEFTKRDSNSSNSGGVFYVYNNSCFININLGWFKEEKTIFKSKVEELIHVLLHELGHYFDFIKKYKNNKKNNEEIEKFYIRSSRIRRYLQRKLSREDYGYYITSANEGEVNADDFYFENLELYRNIYNYDGILLGCELNCGKIIRNYDEETEIVKNIRRWDVTKKQIKIFKNNEYWISKLKVPFDMSDEELNKSYNEYKRLGGGDEKDTYKENIETFYKITFNSYIMRTSFKTDNEKDGNWKDKNECWNCWCGYIGCKLEAGLYFESIDNIHSYC